jgi:hypothetical protein
MSLRIALASIVLLAIFPSPSIASPISVAGFTFSAGEEAFADSIEFVSGWPVNLPVVNDVLVGSDISDSFNSGNSTPSVLDVFFIDNSIVNGPGVDVVIFELSGDKPAGSPDPREIFDVSVFDGSGFSPFVTVTPIATGFDDPADSTLDVFAVQIDLGSFGVPSGVSVDRIRIAIYNANLGSKSADLTAVGALNSGLPVPAPSTALTLAAGLFLIAQRRNRARRRMMADSMRRRT